MFSTLVVHMVAAQHRSALEQSDKSSQDSTKMTATFDKDKPFYMNPRNIAIAVVSLVAIGSVAVCFVHYLKQKPAVEPSIDPSDDLDWLFEPLCDPEPELGLWVVDDIRLIYRGFNNILDKWGRTPLMLAIRKRRIKVAKMLLDWTDNVDQKDGYCDTALHYAASQNLLDIVSILLTKTKLTAEPNKHGSTPLMLACFNHNSDVARMLLDRMDNVDHKDNDGNTALHFAASNGLLDIVEILLTKAQLLNDQNNNGDTAFSLAGQHGHHNVERLISAKITSLSS